MLSNILVAIDGSKPSTQALEMAIEMAKKFDAKLHLIHVVREMQLPPELQHFAELESVRGTRQDVLNTIGERLVNQGKRVAETNGVTSVESDIGTGDPANAIIGYANRNGIDLIVLGSRGLGQVEGMLMGSVSRKVSNLATVPCMVV
jgi:nucleotide-binding universal stress UspA family protein